MIRKIDDWFSRDEGQQRKEGRLVEFARLGAISFLRVAPRRGGPVSSSSSLAFGEARASTCGGGRARRAPRPDLRDERVTADQLPEDGWLQLARELMESGELRLALRAFYLAGLAHLGHRELIQLARHKSNRDYDRELRRRARGKTGTAHRLRRQSASFERVWYGEHTVTPDTLGELPAEPRKDPRMLRKAVAR